MARKIHSILDQQKWWEDDRVLSKSRDTSFFSDAFLTKSLASFCGDHKWREVCAKLNRKWLGCDFKHMRHVSDRLRMEQNEDLSWRVYWKGQEVVVLPPTRSVMNSLKEEVFIVVTGPSAKEVDLSKLEGKSIMGGNGAIALLLECGLKPSDYVITDRDFFENRMNLVEEAIFSGARCFFSMNGLARICEHDPNLLKRGNIYLIETVDRYYGLPQIGPKVDREIYFDWCLLPKIDKRDNLRIGWSFDASKGVFSGCTVAYIAAQLAVSLGYQKLFFIGLDLGGSKRAYDEGENVRPTTLTKDCKAMILPSFELMYKASKVAGFRAYNLSPVSRLPETLFPVIDLEKSFEIAYA